MAETKLIRKIVIKVEGKEDVAALTDIFEKFDKAVDKFNKVIDNFANKLAKAGAASAKLKTQTADSVVGFEKLSNALERFNANVVKTVEENKATALSFEVLNREKSRLVATTNKLIRTQDLSARAVRELDEAVGKLNLSMRSYNKQAQGREFESQVSGLEGLLRAIKQLEDRYIKLAESGQLTAEKLGQLDRIKSRLIAKANKLIRVKNEDKEITNALDKAVSRLNVTAKKYRQELTEQERREKQELRIKERIAKATNALSERNKKLTERVNQLKDKLAQANKRGRHFSSVLDEWWQRFGKVALGFTIVYRGFNALEFGVQKVVDLMKEGVSVAGQWTSMQAKMAMWAMIFPSNAKSFSDAFNKAAQNVHALVAQFPEALSGIDDLTQGFDELAQHGVFATRENAHSLMRFMDFINMIAQTTHESARQVRQEIQSIFEGQARAGNTFLYLVRKLGIQYQDLVKRVREGGDVTEAFMELIARFTPYLDKMYKTLARGDVEVAARRWHMLVVYGFAEATQKVSKMHKQTNLFANDLYESANRIKKAFSGKLGAEWAVSVELLHKGFNSLLRMFESLLKVLPKVIILGSLFFKTISKYKYVIVTVVSLKLLSKAIVRAAEAFVGLRTVLTEVNLVTYLSSLVSPITMVAAALLALYETYKHIQPHNEAEEPSLLASWIAKLFGKDTKASLKEKSDKTIKFLHSMWGKLTDTTRKGGDLFLSDLTDLGKKLSSIYSNIFSSLIKSSKKSLQLTDVWKEFQKELAKLKKEFSGEELKGGTSPNINYIRQLEGNISSNVSALHSILVQYAKQGKDYTKIQKDYASAVQLQIKNLEAERTEIDKQLKKWKNKLNPADLAALKVRYDVLTDQIDKLKNSLKDALSITEKMTIASKITNLSTDAKIALQKIKNEFDGNTAAISRATIAITQEYIHKINDFLTKWADKLTPAQKAKLRKLRESLITEMKQASKHALSFWDALAKGAHDYVQSANNYLEDFRQSTKQVFSDLEDTLVQWMQTGKLDFKHFLREIASMYEHILVRKFLVKPFAEGSESIFKSIMNYFSGSGAASAVSNWVSSAKDWWSNTNKSFWTSWAENLFSSLGGSYVSSAISSAEASSTSSSSYTGPSTEDYMKWYQSASIAKSAYGNVFDKPTLTLAGEGPYKEAVIPMLNGDHVLAKVMDSQQQPININVYANDPQSAARAVKQAMVQLNKNSTSIHVRKF